VGRKREKNQGDSRLALAGEDGSSRPRWAAVLKYNSLLVSN